MNRFNLTFDPVLPWPLIAALGGLLALVLVVLAWQHVRGAALRAIASALLVLALTNPVLKREERDPLPGVVALVVDESASQKLGKRSEQTERAVAQLKERPFDGIALIDLQAGSGGAAVAAVRRCAGELSAAKF